VVAVLGRGVVPPDTLVLRADDLGALRGDGIFETMHLRAGRPLRLGDDVGRHGHDHLRARDRGAGQSGERRRGDEYHEAHASALLPHYDPPFREARSLAGPCTRDAKELMEF